MGRVGVLLVHFGRGEVVYEAVHTLTPGILERIIELIARLAVVRHTGSAVIVVADGQQFVDGGQIPALALVATPFESRKIIPREVVGRNVLRHLLHILHSVGTVVGAGHAQIGFAELAPMEVNFVERHHQAMQAVVRKLANHTLDAVLVIEFADLVLFEHILSAGNRLRRDSRGCRSLRNRRNCRDSRGQRRCRDTLGIILLFAVGILDVMNLRNGKYVSRTIGIRETHRA